MAHIPASHESEVTFKRTTFPVWKNYLFVTRRINLVLLETLAKVFAIIRGSRRTKLVDIRIFDQRNSAFPRSGTDADASWSDHPIGCKPAPFLGMMQGCLAIFGEG